MRLLNLAKITLEWDLLDLLARGEVLISIRKVVIGAFLFAREGFVFHSHLRLSSLHIS